MDCWLRKVLPAAAVDNQQFIIFRTTPMNQCTIWNSTTYWPGKFLPAAAVENSNHLCGTYGSTLNQPIGYLGTLGVMQTWWIQLVEWSIDNTLL